ncbi:MAG: hypothetical protein Q9227_007783 [Pyrenula ochraceoflavens]
MRGIGDNGGPMDTSEDPQTPSALDVHRPLLDLGMEIEIVRKDLLPELDKTFHSKNKEVDFPPVKQQVFEKLDYFWWSILQKAKHYNEVEQNEIAQNTHDQLMPKRLDEHFDESPVDVLEFELKMLEWVYEEVLGSPEVEVLHRDSEGRAL